MRILTGATECDAVVFDMDGVLIDTRRSFTECVLRPTPHCLRHSPRSQRRLDATHVEELRLCGASTTTATRAAALALEGREATPWRAMDQGVPRASSAEAGPTSVIRRRGEDPWRVMLAIVGPGLPAAIRGSESAGSLRSVPATEGQGSCENEILWCLATELETLGSELGDLHRDRREAAWECASSVPLASQRAADFALESPLPQAAAGRPPRVGRSHEGDPAFVFVGDNLDDLSATRNARNAGLDVGFVGIAPKEAPAPRGF